MAPPPITRRLCSSPGSSALLERHPAAAPIDVDRVFGREAAFEDRLGERVLELRLDGALERSRAVHRVEPPPRKLAWRGVGDLELVVHLRQPRLQHLELHPRDGLDVLLAE